MPVEQINFENQFQPRVTFLTLKPGESAKVGFIEDVPGRSSAVTKFAQHWIAEKEDGHYIMCEKGLCCEVMTWNELEKDYTKSKAKTVYWVPIVMYYPDPETMQPQAGLGILSLNSFQFSKLVEQVNSCEPGTLPFFSRDCTVSFDKNGQYNDYNFIKSEKRAIWQENKAMAQTIADQLKTFSDEIDASLPPSYSEVEMAELIEKWNKIKALKARTNVEDDETATADTETTTSYTDPETVTKAPKTEPVPEKVETKVEPVSVAVEANVEPTTTEITPETFNLADLAKVLEQK